MPVFQWAKQLGSGTNSDGHSVAVDASGNVYTVGTFFGTADFNPGTGVYNLTSNGSYDAFISKLDASGNFVWAKKIGGINNDDAFSIKISTIGNIYVTGYFADVVDFDPGTGILNLTSFGGEDIFILKLNTAGNFIWAKNMGGVFNDNGYGITIDGTENSCITGFYSDTADFDPGVGIFNLNPKGSKDVFICKLDPSGNLIWANGMGGTLDDVANSVVGDASSNIYITGYFRDTIDFDPGSGVSVSSSFGGEDIFILKFDSFGNLLWAKNIGGASNDTGYSLALDASGNVYSTGWFAVGVDFDPGAGTANLNATGAPGPTDVFILKLDSLGNYVMAKNMGGTSSELGLSVITDFAENIYITGNFIGTADFDPGVGVSNLVALGVYDVFITKLDNVGNFVWAKSVGSTSYDSGRSITLDASGKIYVCGYFQGAADFNPGSGVYNLFPVGSSDVFVLKWSQSLTGVDEDVFFNHSILIYPNPTSNNLTIETTKPTNISIVNLLGQELFNSKIEKSQTIDVSFLSNGIYFVKDLQNGGSVKFIKQ